MAGAVRVLWPLGLVEYLIKRNNESCILLGVAFMCKHMQCGDMALAAVIGVCRQDLSLQQAQQQLQGRTLCIATDHEPFEASVAVLGTWTAHAVQQPTPAVCARQDSMWLAMHGSQPLQDRLCLDGCRPSKQQHLAPQCHIQQCLLPPGADLQVLLYEVPVTAHSSCLLQPAVQQQASSLPWMIRPPGTVSLSSLLQLLQQVHSHIAATQQLLEQNDPSQQHTMQQQQHDNDQQAQPPQQQQQQQQTLCEAQAARQQLGALLAWPSYHSSSKSRWQSRVLSCWASKWRRKPEAAVAAAAAAAVQDTHAELAGSSGTSSSGLGVLPGLMQHLLGLVAAWLLLRHRHELLHHAAAAGSWLQHELLQPHIDWLMQAHPGGIKLHCELSLLLASAATQTLQLAAAFYAAAWPLLGPVLLLLVAAVAGFCGAVAGCAAAADGVLLLLWPLVVVYVGCAAFHRLQLRCLLATWRLIRGRQKVRRFSERWRQQQQQQAAPTTDSNSNSASSSLPSSSAAAASGAAAAAPDTAAGAQAASAPPGAAAASTAAAAASTTAAPEAAAGDEVSVEQLIVGVLLFTPLVGLFPTTAAWYLSVCCCHGAVLLLRQLLLAVASLLQLRALHTVGSRWMQPQQFPGQLMVQLLQQCEGSSREGTAVSSGAGASSSGSRGPQQQQQQGVLVSHYRVYHAPLSYAQVLQLCWARQSAGGNSSQTGLGGRMLGLLKAVLKGQTWGVGLYSSSLYRR